MLIYHNNSMLLNKLFNLYLESINNSDKKIIIMYRLIYTSNCYNKSQ